MASAASGGFGELDLRTLDDLAIYSDYLRSINDLSSQLFRIYEHFSGQFFEIGAKWSGEFTASDFTIEDFQFEEFFHSSHFGNGQGLLGELGWDRGTSCGCGYNHMMYHGKKILGSGDGDLTYKGMSEIDGSVVSKKGSGAGFEEVEYYIWMTPEVMGNRQYAYFRFFGYSL